MVNSRAQRSRIRWWSWARLLIGLIAAAAIPLLMWSEFSKEARFQSSAEYTLLHGSPSAARLQAEELLSTQPLDVAALRTAGLAAEMEGDLEAAGRLMGIAAGLGWRDTPTQFWMLRSALYQGDLWAAALHADALARRDIDRSKMIRILQAMVEYDVGMSAVVAALARQPNWRPDFFSGADLPSGSVIHPLLANLEKEGAPVTPRELGALVNRFVEAGDYASAHRLWSTFSKVGMASQGSSVSDGSFEWAGFAEKNDATHTPFEWRLRSSRGTMVAVSPPPNNPANPALMIVARGSETAIIASQMLLLPPGRHFLQYRILEEDRIAGDLPFKWRFKCAPETSPHLSSTEVERDEVSGWHVRRLAVTVPSHGCPAQLLELEYLSSRSMHENRIWIDDVWTD